MDLQEKYNESVKISQDINELKNQFLSMKEKLRVAKESNMDLTKRLVTAERLSWGNAQYARRECLELTGINPNIEDNNLEKKVLEIFKKIEVNIDTGLVESCHRLKSRSNRNAVIIKLSKRKDVMKVLHSKNKLKDLDLQDIGLGNVYINESLCNHYKLIWSKSKMLYKRKVISSFFVSNGKVKIKVGENTDIITLTHINDLVNLFPEINIFEDYTV